MTAVNVAVYAGSAVYPRLGPFHPAAQYPEYELKAVGEESNAAYDAVRECLFLSGLDRHSFGSACWNPFHELVTPGETILLKPNLVRESHPRDPEGWQYVITHGSIIRAVSDYLWKAMKGRGTIIVGDAPQTDSSFARIQDLLQLDSLTKFYRSSGLDFSVVDLRKEEWRNEGGVIVDRRQLAGDPEGYVKFDLGNSSEFYQHKGVGQYYGADYCERELNGHHSKGRHEYLISGTAIKADVVFSLPKLKTHKKAGITVSLKNLVGINGDKNWLPHHTESSLRFSGDERPQVTVKGLGERWIARRMRQLSLVAPQMGKLLHQPARKAGSRMFGDTESVVRSGNWWGNDTLWRTCLDLNKILLYGNADGTMRSPRHANRKRHYVLVDGIIAGDGNGPMNPDAVHAGVVVFGTEAPRVDAVCAALMGFDSERIPILRNAFAAREYLLVDGAREDTTVISNRRWWSGNLAQIETADTLNFRPHFGWVGHIERSRASIRSQESELAAIGS